MLCAGIEILDEMYVVLVELDELYPMIAGSIVLVAFDITLQLVDSRKVWTFSRNP